MIDRLREWLVAERLDAAYLTDPLNIAYLTGFATNPHERLMALAVRPEGATLIVPGLEAESAGQVVGDEVLVRGWKDGEEPYRLVADALEGARQVGIEKGHLSYAAAERLLAMDLELADAEPQMRRLRARKNAAELGLLEKAAAATDLVTARIFEDLAPGQTELEIANRLSVLISETGCTPAFDSIVQSGPHSAMPHLRPSARPLHAGDLVLLDFGAAHAGYRGDTSRTWVVGAPDRRQLEIHAAVLEAHDRAIDAVRAGARAGEVDEAARAVIRAAGLGRHFIHRVGHGLGLDAHEDPSLDPGSPTVLEPGMVITIEPGVYIPGWGGVRIEDDVVVEEAGARLLTSSPRELASIG